MSKNPVADVREKKILVIGGARGIGLGIARRFAEVGANVVLTARSDQAAEKVSAELSEQMDCQVNWASLDVTEEQLEDKMRGIFSQYGVPDALIYNAGICPDYARAEKIPLAGWDIVYETNLRGAIRASLVYGGQCIAEQQKGSIILISSMAGILAGEKLAPYVTAKTAMLGLTRALAMDWAKSGIRVNAVAPGWVDTDLTTGLQGNEWLNNKLVADIPMGHFAKADEIADMIVFLASESASYVTGATYSVDGGLVAGK